MGLMSRIGALRMAIQYSHLSQKIGLNTLEMVGK